MRRRTTLLGLALASAISFSLAGFAFTANVQAEEIVAVDEAAGEAYTNAEDLVVIDSGILTAERYAPL